MTQALFCIIVMALVLNPIRAAAEEPLHYSHKQLRTLMAGAEKAGDYQRLASYFHYRELMLHAKAQRTIDEYVLRAGKYPMATKILTRAEIALRLYEDYSCEKDVNAKLARRYEKKLIELGLRPKIESETLVSVKSLIRR